VPDRVILVLVEHDGARPIPASVEALTLARDLAGGFQAPLAALLLGDGAHEVAADLAEYGVSVAHVIDDARLAGEAPAAWASALAALVGRLGPRAVVAAGTTRGQEVLAAAAARLGVPFAAGCIDARAGDLIQVTRQRWAGSVLEDAEIDGPIVFLSVPEHAVQGRPAGGPQTRVRIEAADAGLDSADLRVRLVERIPPMPGAISLADARVVVGGGRGVGGPAGFAALEELAVLLGGTIGVSRVVTSAGWRPHADQVGQTGTRIAPDLYIACGISGAIQHIVGCRSAKTILAINTDPDAPIMRRADYAVIGDLHEVVPAISAELRRVAGRL
jgi:electron transfer flavoprotein alpha subunit